MPAERGYGTSIDNSSQNGDPGQASSDDEARGLLAKDTKSSRSNGVRDFMTADVHKHRADLVLLLCYVITGLLDSSAVFIWGAFASMQTGNTIYLGLGLVEPATSTRWVKSLVSIGFFCIGSVCFSSFHRLCSPRRRWVLLTSFTIQMLFIMAAALIVLIDDTTKGPEHELHWHVLVPLGMLAFQSSGQAVSSRALQYNSLTSVVLTSIYCDLFSDPTLLTTGFMENPERNRRVAAPLLLLTGSIIGGVFAHGTTGLAGALWVAAGLKFLIVLAWLQWKPEPGSDDEDEA